MSKSLPHPAIVNAVYAANLEREERAQRREEEYRFGFKCMMLAPTLDIYHALLRGENVPLDRLNQEAVARYGLRRAA